MYLLICLFVKMHSFKQRPSDLRARSISSKYGGRVVLTESRLTFVSFIIVWHSPWTTLPPCSLPLEQTTQSLYERLISSRPQHLTTEVGTNTQVSWLPDQYHSVYNMPWIFYQRAQEHEDRLLKRSIMNNHRTEQLKEGRRPSVSPFGAVCSELQSTSIQRAEWHVWK